MRPQILNLRYRNQIRSKILLSRKLFHFRGNTNGFNFDIQGFAMYLSFDYFMFLPHPLSPHNKLAALHRCPYLNCISSIYSFGCNYQKFDYIDWRILLFLNLTLNHNCTTSNTSKLTPGSKCVCVLCERLIIIDTLQCRRETGCKSKNNIWTNIAKCPTVIMWLFKVHNQQHQYNGSLPNQKIPSIHNFTSVAEISNQSKDFRFVCFTFPGINPFWGIFYFYFLFLFLCFIILCSTLNKGSNEQISLDNFDRDTDLVFLIYYNYIQTRGSKGKQLFSMRICFNNVKAVKKTLKDTTQHNTAIWKKKRCSLTYNGV